MKQLKVFCWFVLLVMLIAACGGGDDGQTEEVSTGDAAAETAVDTAEQPPTDTPDPTATPEPETTAVSSLDDVEKAVVQIVAEGTFVDPQAGLQLNAAGSGSGFIIDESGIAITNNHVVGGAALVKVYVYGEDRPRNAKILGVSECSDLAVIDIDGEGFSYLEWHEGDINVGLDVYTAGFPLGDPEFTLTRGVVSKAQASGETVWASVDSVLEHDATINPGNSGGPLVDSNGRIVGINYAGNANTNQYYAISQEEALPIIETLQNGQDITSIGINGFATGNDNGLTGIWVSAVVSGSPADTAGLQPGDLITKFQGLVMATDGTMSDFCDILRTHEPEDTMDIEVIRLETEEVLAGQLNGRELEPVFSFAQELDQDVPTNASNTTTASYNRYVTVSDDAGLLFVDIPAAWSDVDGSPWVNSSTGELIGAAVRAAPDLNGFDDWTAPGVDFRATVELGDLSVEDALDVLDYSDICQYGNRNAFSDSRYTGAYDLWSNCSSQDSLYVVLAVKPASDDVLILIQVHIMSDADLEALDNILASFSVGEG